MCTPTAQKLPVVRQDNAVAGRSRMVVSSIVKLAALHYTEDGTGFPNYLLGSW